MSNSPENKNIASSEISDEALYLAAQCWCDEDTSDIEMDARLARAVARRIDVWIKRDNNLHNKAKKEAVIGEFAATINRYSLENGSDTPDFMLAEYLFDCIETFNRINTVREKWYGRGVKEPITVLPPGQKFNESLSMKNNAKLNTPSLEELCPNAIIYRQTDEQP